MEGKYKISVLMSVYNHQLYLRDAVQSVLNQIIDDKFSVELVCSDDASTDSSLEILENIKASECWSSSFEMVILQSKTNVGGSKNFTKALQGCTGDFISWIEPDDVWHCKHKLLSQFEEMVRDADCQCVGHELASIAEDHEISTLDVDRKKNTPSYFVSQTDIARGRRPAVTSLMLRRDSYCLKTLCDRINIGPRNAGDLTIALFLSSAAEIKIIKAKMAVYRNRNRPTENNYNSITPLKNKIEDRLKLIGLNADWYEDVYFGLLYLKLFASSLRHGSKQNKNLQYIKMLTTVIFNLIRYHVKFSASRLEYDVCFIFYRSNFRLFSEL